MDDTHKKITDFAAFIKKQPKGFAYFDPSEKQTRTETKKTTSLAGCKKSALKTLYGSCTDCKACPLGSAGRTQVVFGVGNPETKIMFVGEGPGRDEDIKGEPFVGRAGQLLTKIIEAMGLTREQVYISNVVKCRPPENRTPLPDESAICKDLMLLKEIDIIKPSVICTLGATATKALLGEDIKITSARGVFHDFNGIAVMPTYHPAYLLRNPAEKRTVWEDMKKIMTHLEMPLPQTDQKNASHTAHE